jgi:tetratricopeptide (TPR) repeat protein
MACVLAFSSLTKAAEESRAELAKKAGEIIRNNCYRCHGQDGAIEGGMNYILDFRQLVARKKVVPGEPSKSKLYKRLTSKNNPMPPEEEKIRPTSADIALLRKWIEAGAPAAEPVDQRKFISEADILNTIHEDLQKLDARSRPFARYFTLSHLWNAGLSEDEMQTFRRGLSKLINSLSWQTEIVKPQMIDPAGTVLRIDLRDYRWGPVAWRRILEQYPYGVIAGIPEVRVIALATGCELAYVRADWFVFAASRPPLYHDLLQLPATARELEEALKIDVAADIQGERVARAGFNSSGVSRNNRLIERHATAYGAYWKSYDFAGNTGRQNLFAHPLGPGTEDGLFRHDGGEIIFSLPNGLQVYLLVDGQGNRINEGPIQIVSVKNQADPRVINGVSCMFCHARGMIDKSDEIRSHVAKNADAFAEAEAKTILALYPPEKDFKSLLQKDAERFRRAVEATGVKLGATEPVAALVGRFEAELDLVTAAAEAGLTPADFLRALNRSGELAQRLGTLRIEGGTVQRQAFADCFEELVEVLRLGNSLTRLDKLLAESSKAIRLSPKEAAAYYQRGRAYSTKNDFDPAVADFNEAIRLDPGHSSSFVQRAWAYLAKGEYKKSIADNTEAIRLDPHNADAFFNRGGAQAILGNHDGAIADYSEVIRLEPRNANAYANRGRAYARKGLLEKAADDYAEAVRRDESYFGLFKAGVEELENKGLAEAATKAVDHLARDRPKDERILALRQSLKKRAKKKVRNN